MGICTYIKGVTDTKVLYAIPIKTLPKDYVMNLQVIFPYVILNKSISSLIYPQRRFHYLTIINECRNAQLIKRHS